MPRAPGPRKAWVITWECHNMATQPHHPTVPQGSARAVFKPRMPKAHLEGALIALHQAFALGSMPIDVQDYLPNFPATYVMPTWHHAENASIGHDPEFLLYRVQDLRSIDDGMAGRFTWTRPPAPLLPEWVQERLRAAQ